jgi:hypothetical protein
VEEQAFLASLKVFLKNPSVNETEFEFIERFKRKGDKYYFT